MWIDIIIAVFLIFCIFRGDKRGFVLSFTSTFGWIISLIGGYYFKPAVISWLDTNTTVRHDMTIKITEYFVSILKKDAESQGATSDLSLLPDSVTSALSSAAQKAYEAAAAKVASPVVDLIISLIAFLIIVVCIKIVMYLIERIVRVYTDKDGAIGNINSIAGMLFNLIRGCIVSYLVVLFLLMISLIGNITPLLEVLTDSLIVTVLSDIGLIPISADIITGASILEVLKQ